MINAHSIKTTLLQAATQLKAQGIEAESAKLEAQLLLQHAFHVNRAWLIAHEHENLATSIEAAYRAMLERRLNGEPIAYILGYREFYGLKLKVTADTLIPRADTETLVEAALAKIALLLAPSPQPSPTGGEGVKVVQSVAASSPSPQRGRGVGERGENGESSAIHSPRPLAGEGVTEHDVSSSASFRRKSESSGVALLGKKTLDSDFRRNDELRILDLGTGTGAIALAIAKHRPQVLVTALDASQAALDIAIENAQNLSIPNVEFILSDWFSAIQNEKFDIIVSNPPYIEAADAHLKLGDLRYEPISALASGADGLDDIRAIITNAPLHLNPHGWLLLEHGYNQASAVTELLLQHQFIEISTLKDLGGNNRVTIGRLN
jgi:release factor-specific protein-(glutamine-N5) methyltransferase